jgi:hypothetical protein
MAHWAELDINNNVLRTVVGGNDDIANHGGELSEEAAEYFKTICPLSINGVKWIQTSYNRNFRKNYAGTGMTYDLNRDAFIPIKPFSSWILNESTCIWEPPVSEVPENQKDGKAVDWYEPSLTWEGRNYTQEQDGTQNVYHWNLTNNSWDLFGNYNITTNSITPI